MRLELEQIQDRVSRTEDEQRGHRKLMDEWEKMWNLDAGFQEPDWRKVVLSEGREQVTTPDPYNIINLAMRLIPTEPKIDVPPADETEDANQNAQQKERFLTAMYPRVNYQQGKNFVEEHKWQLFTLGRSPLQALWIKEDLPEKLRKRQFPILIRTLNPRNVGIKRGPHYVEWAYHKYESEKLDIRQQYPDLKKWDEPKPDKPTDNESHLVCVTDFWYRAKNGAVWHAILVEDEFAMEPKATDYPVIPIIDASGDHDSMSILHAINGLWQYKCRLASNLGTAVLWYTWPHFMVTTPLGFEMPDLVVRPGATSHAPEGTKIQEIRPEANAQLLDNMLAKVDTSIQQSTFPGVLYGDAGNMQAGYGVNILSQAATGRVQAVREAMERSLMQLNELVLMLIDTFDDDNEGVELWGRDEGSGHLYKTCLYKEQIDGYYENAVQLKVSTPQDDIALQTLGIRLLDGGYISLQTFWDKYLKITVPDDERKRIMTDMALKHPEIQKALSISNMIQTHPLTWQSLVRGTDIELQAYRIATEDLVDKDLIVQAIPPAILAQLTGNAPPQLPQMQGPPPGMPPMGGPPMPPQGPSMPPPAAPIQPGAELIPPMGGGVPPEMQGQMGGGEAMGLPPDMDPALFAQIMNLPMGSGEELNLMGGQ